MPNKRKRRGRRKNKIEVIHKSAFIDNIVQSYNILGVLSALWALFYPSPFKLSITMSIIFGLAGFIILIIFNKNVGFIVTDGSLPSVGITISLNSLSISLTGFICSNTIYTSIFWIYFTITCIILTLSMIFIQHVSYKNITSLFFLLISIPSYSFGLITNINYLYDNSNPTLYTTSIINKEIYTSGEKVRINVDQVVVSPWGNMNKNSVVAVSEDSYNQVSENERVFIGLKHGLLGISWYYLEL